MQLNLSGLSINTTYNVSCFVKKADAGNLAKLFFETTETGRQAVMFNFDTEVISIETGSPTNLDFLKINDNWYRISFNVTTSNSISSPFIYLNRSNSNLSCYYWGIQLEELPYATSYIPNNGNAAGETRDAETASKSGLSDYINSSEGVLYLELSALADDGTFRNIAISDGTSSNRILFFLASTDNQIGFRVDVGGVIESAFSYNVTDFTEYFKVAMKYKENDFSLWVNGIEVGSDSLGSVFSPSTLNRIGFDGGAGSGDFYGKVKDLRVYKTALTDTELQTLTS